MFLLFVMIGTMSFAMERPRRQGEYTIMEFSRDPNSEWGLKAPVATREDPYWGFDPALTPQYG